MNRVKAFQCEFCKRKVGMNKTHIAEHERICFKNPRRRACQTCGNRCEDYDTVYNPHHGGDPGSTDYEVLTVWCEERERNIEDLPKWKTCDCEFWKPLTL